jgi:D-hexose-6-phosphate mutarotase
MGVRDQQAIRGGVPEQDPAEGEAQHEGWPRGPAS